MIRDKIIDIINTKTYLFCDISFKLYDTDFIRIYDKIDGNIVYEKQIKFIRDDINLTIFDKNSAKEELIKISSSLKSPYAVCFYLGKPKEIVEGPISVKMNYIN